jgi:hypothetical protein
MGDPEDAIARAVGKLVVTDPQYNPQGPEGPISNPVDRFIHLPPSTRQWLEQLRPQDLQEISEAVAYMRSAKVLGKFGRWFIVTLVSTFIGAVLFGEKIAVAWKWFTGNRV